MLRKYFAISFLIGLASFLCLNGPGSIFYRRSMGDWAAFLRSHLPEALKSYLTGTASRTINSNARVFSREELSLHDGLQGLDSLYLAVLGRVYDVSGGRHHYAPGGTYHGFTGKDGSKAFLTGDFTEGGLTDDISDLTKEELLSLFDWTKMYDKNYVYRGVVEGRFYDSNGTPTPFLKDIKKKIKEMEDEKKKIKQYEQKYPPCNTEWTQEKGSRVWCSQKSGGVMRSWIGVPRKYYEPGSSTARCACLNLSKEKEGIRYGTIEMYSNCPPDAHSCYINET